LSASGQIKVSCYPFFDTVPAMIATDKSVSKKGYFPTGGLRAGARLQFSASSPVKRKKLKADLAELAIILEILQS
jgi:hypothetical protein